MTTPEPSTAPAQGGIPSSPDISSRAKRLFAAAQSELLSAVMTALVGAEGRGYSMEELEASISGGKEALATLRASKPLTLEQGVEIALACGYRLRIGVEVVDDEVQAAPEDIATPFEVASGWMANHALMKHLAEADREEVLRQILALYFGQMREKGLYISKRG